MASRNDLAGTYQAAGRTTEAIRLYERTLADRERLLARVYPQASADPTLTYRYDPDSGAFTLQARGKAGDAPTVVAIPREVTGEVTALGALTDHAVVSNSDGSRLVTATPSGGVFSIAVAAAPLSLTACP